ncbi:hypothetical protein [uncultured Fibrobacter sp.]|uniref:hypothetical protein n=1 Tax=uncultured Fibrobacter sp. TaxID=261512 RepID=UPI002626B7AA|nr:hypothetical protein [uncultured Fibrobacter sp.]
MKRLVFGLLLVSSLAWTSEEKVSYLPPYEPHSSVSPKVQEFLESSKSLDLGMDSASVGYDVLGRKNRWNRFTNSKLSVPRQAKMNVQVVSLSVPEMGEQTVFAEYRFENGVPRYWLNGNPVSEENYFNSIEKNGATHVPNYVVSLTAEEIKSLLQGPEPIYISEITDAEDAAVYTKILDTTTVSTWAFSNGYNGDGIGVYIAENGCPKSSVINTTHFVQNSSCSNGVTSHATSLVRIFQTTAPNAVLFQYAQG